MTETITIRLGKTAKGKLKELADADHRKLASYVTMLLEQHIAEKHPALPVAKKGKRS